MTKSYPSIESCIPDWIVNVTNVYFILLDRAGNLLFSNQAFTSAFEISSDQKKHHFSALRSFPENATIQKIYETSLNETGQPTDWFLESRSFVTNQKLLVQWNFNIACIQDENCLIGIGQKSHNSDFVSLDSHYSYLLKALNKSVIFFICDLSGNMELVNDNLCDFTKYERSTLIGNSLYQIIEEYNPSKYWDDLLSTLQRETLDVNELRIKTKCNNIYWTRSLINPICDADGNLKHILFVLYDITKHKNIEQEKIELFNKYQKITANLPGFIYQFQMHKDGSMSFPFITNGVTKLFGTRPSKLKSNATPAFQRIHPDNLEQVYESLMQSAKNLTVWNQVFRVLNARNEVVWIQGIATPERLEDESIIWHGFNFDITDKKISEEKLRKQRKRLDEIAFIQAHEFRRPVANMLGLFDILNTELNSETITPKQFNHWLELMKKSVKETDEIIAKIVTKAAEDEAAGVTKLNGV